MNLKLLISKTNTYCRQFRVWDVIIDIKDFNTAITLCWQTIWPAISVWAFYSKRILAILLKKHTHYKQYHSSHRQSLFCLMQSSFKMLAEYLHTFMMEIGVTQMIENPQRSPESIWKSPLLVPKALIQPLKRSNFL